eukprot:6476934-Amphidinium_carterae.1
MVVSQNMQGCNLETLADYLPELPREWSALCMQEFGTYVDGQQLVTPEEHLLVVGGSTRTRCTAILLHKALVSKLQQTRYGEYSTSLTLRLPSGLVTIISSHLPHSGYSNEVWHAALDELETHCTSPHLVIGIDANTVVNPEISPHSGPFVCNSPWSDRSVELAALAERHHLYFTNTYDPAVGADFKLDRWSAITWRSWNSERQIDFTMTSLPFARSGVYDVCYPTDHRAVQVECEMEVYQRSRHGPRTLLKWKPVTQTAFAELLPAPAHHTLTDTEYNDYVQALHQAASATAAPSRRQLRYDAVNDIQPQNYPNTRAWRVARAQAVRAQREINRIADLRDALQNRLSKMETRRILTGRIASKPLQSLNGNVDRDCWPTIVATFWASVFALPEHQQQSEQHYYDEMSDKAYEELTAYTDDGDAPPWAQVDAAFVLDLLGTMSSGRGGGPDGLTLEVLRALPWQHLQGLAQLLCGWILGSGLLPSDWAIEHCVLLPKIPHALVVKDFRPIARVPILLRLYGKFLVRQALHFSPGILTDEFPQFAVTKGLRGTEAIMNLKLILERCWSQNVPVWIAKLDIRKAFDSILHSAIGKGLEDLAVPVGLIDAFLILLRHNTCYMHLGEITSDAIPKHRGTGQGHTESPFLFCVGMRYALLGLWRLWSTLPSLLPWHLLLFMDDILLAASTWDELLDKLLAVQAALHTIGLELNVEKSIVVTNVLCPPLEVQVGTQPIPVRGEFVYLGVHFCHKGDTMETYFHRVRAAWAAFWKWARLLTAHQLPLRDRLRLLDSTVFGALGYGLECLTLTKQLFQHLRALQHTMLIKVYGVKRCAVETWVDYQIRARRFVRSQLPAGTRWSSRVAFRWWHWAGHCGRLPPQRASTVKWLDLAHTQTRRALGGSPELRVGFNRRWERLLMDVFQGPWQHHACQREHWGAQYTAVFHPWLVQRAWL